ncbi:MAG TPA: ABC transporter ATP-binding protein [Chloroflexota bacterium]|nr:ABC transporter ATP-binding protein [Chloroflexota bacterium]
MDPVIRTENLTKSYGSNRGIEGVNLTVCQGEVFGFLGPNGAGKTTTIRTLMNFLRPTSGRAWVFGLDTQRDSVAVHAQLGNLPSEFSFDEKTTGRGLIRLFARLRGVRDITYAEVLAERLNVDLDRPIRRLSRGNKQKIGLIQAMFHRPSLLILDEPTGGLDPLIQEEFLHMVGEVPTEGRTVFFSSHNLPEVERVCDRVGIIREGKLVTVETIDSLLGKRVRLVTLTFTGPIDSSPFARIPGISDVRVAGNSITFHASDSLDPVVKLAAQHTLVDLSVERPSLEEIFLTYYGGHP